MNQHTRKTHNIVRFRRFSVPQSTMASDKRLEATDTHRLYVGTVPSEVKANNDD